MIQPQRREPTTLLRQGLIKALSRYGYTHIDYPPAHYAADGWNDTQSYYPDHSAFCVRPEADKPYYCYFGPDHLILIHKDCTKCVELPVYEHDTAFLKELIPIIGRLDGHAEYIPGEAPRLYISL